MADSILANGAQQTIRDHVKTLGAEVWGDPVAVGDKWHAVVAFYGGPLVKMEFGVSMNFEVAAVEKKEVDGG